MTTLNRNKWTNEDIMWIESKAKRMGFKIEVRINEVANESDYLYICNPITDSYIRIRSTDDGYYVRDNGYCENVNKKYILNWLRDNKVED